MKLLEAMDPMLNTPKRCYEYCEVYGSSPELEKIIAQSATYSYLYAKDILKGPFPLGEQTIAKADNYAYLYAINILEDRFKIAESCIFNGNETVGFIYAAAYISKLADKFTNAEKIHFIMTKLCKFDNDVIKEICQHLFPNNIIQQKKWIRYGQLMRNQ